MRWLLLVYLVAQAIAADDSLEHSDAFAQCAADPASCTSLYVPAALHPMHATSPHDIPFLPIRIRIVYTHVGNTRRMREITGPAPLRHRRTQGCRLGGGYVG